MSPSTARPAVREMTRTVHPELAAAALGALDGAPLPLCAVRASRLLAQGGPVPEALHREVLAALHARGWPAVQAAGRQLFSRPADPLLRFLITARDVPEALARAHRVEPWLHVGHRTTSELAGNSLTVRHHPYLGGPPSLAESLFVCAVYAAAVSAITGTPPAVALLAPDGRELPPHHPDPPTAWRLCWPTAPAAPTSTDDLLQRLRRRLSLDPSADWRLPATAAQLGVPPRTLQRSLSAAGTTFSAELAAARINTAGHLLRRTALPLAEVAAAAGFTDHPHLTRRFRAHHGRTPSEFRHTRPDG